MRTIIISQDYDGCYCIMTDAGFAAERDQINASYWRPFIAGGGDYAAQIKPIRDRYNAFLNDITVDAESVHVYVGSDRQSKDLDDLNADNNHNGSVFPALENLCRERTTLAKPWKFEPLLLADPLITGTEPYKRKRGEAYQHITKREEPQLSNSEPRVYFRDAAGKLKTSKRPLLLNQMWDAYRQNPEATELEFHFIDDRQDLIDDVLERLDPSEMPPNMTLVVSKFDYLGIMEEDAKALGQCGKVVSKNPASTRPVLLKETTPPALGKMDSEHRDTTNPIMQFFYDHPRIATGLLTSASMALLVLASCFVKGTDVSDAKLALGASTLAGTGLGFFMPERTEKAKKDAEDDVLKLPYPAPSD